MTPDTAGAAGTIRISGKVPVLAHQGEHLARCERERPQLVADRRVALRPGIAELHRDRGLLRADAVCITTGAWTAALMKKLEATL